MPGLPALLGKLTPSGGKQLFVIPHSGFKNNWLRASKGTEASGAVAKNFDPFCE